MSHSIFIRPNGISQMLYDDEVSAIVEDLLSERGEIRRISRVDTYHDLVPEAKNLVAEARGFFVDWTISGWMRVDGPFETRAAALAYEKVAAEERLRSNEYDRAACPEERGASLVHHG
jgi:hypothetical protein